MPTLAFPPGQTGSTLLHGAFSQAAERFPAVFAGLDLPASPAQLKRDLPEVIVAFEARRAASEQRVEIARLLADHALEVAQIGETPISEALTSRDVGPAQCLEGTRDVGWIPSVRYRGEDYSGARIAELVPRMRAAYELTEAAATALTWTADNLLSSPVDLREHRFALLGAGAELAPTKYLLAAGARVLWVDRAAPVLDPETFAGTVVHHPGALDLLEHTAAIGAVLHEACAAGPVHLGLYAYAPGRGRELLLTTAMNAIATAVEPTSIAMLVSPTTPGEVQVADRQDRRDRRKRAPRWQRALARARVLSEPAFHAHGDVEISHSIVAMQGPTYLAAQYLTKMMAAEAWAVERPLRVSANVAGITHTKSLEHPLFLAGFIGAPTFGIEVYDAERTRVLSTLLMLHDLLHPAAPGADASGGPAAQAKRLASQSIHGGVRSVPFVLERAIQVAALVGLSKKPGLLLKLRKGR